MIRTSVVRRWWLMVAALCCFPALVFGQATTTVTDSLVGPDGSPATGTMTISAAGGFTSADGHNVPPGWKIRVSLSGGAFSVALIPNQGSNPSGSYYLVVYGLSSSIGSSSWSETWVVPSTGPVGLAAVRTLAPLPQTFLSPQVPNTVLAGPATGSSPGPASFRALVSADLPGGGGGGGGGVSSVGLAMPSIFSVSSSPVTSSGTLTASLVNQSAYSWFGVPTGNPAAPTFNTSPLPAALIPTPTGSTLGGIESIAQTTSNWIQYIDTSGVPHQSQPAFSDISGTLGISRGGTGQTTASAAFNALSPLSMEGDLQYYHSGSNARLGVGSNNQCLTSNGTDPVWGSCGAGSETVTSVGLAMPSIFSVSGSPVTNSGTLTATLTAQTGNQVFASPNGSSGAPGFRAIVAADLPSSIISNTTGNASTATALAATPTGCGTNTFAQSIAANGNLTCTAALSANAGATHYWLSSVTAPGVFSTARPAAADLSDTATSGNYLRGNGTSFVSSAIQASDVPTLNQNTTGNAATATALASTPTGCALNTFAQSIAANGNLTCAATGLNPNDTSVLLAEYHFQEGSGTTLTDFSGNGNNGTLGSGAAAPTWNAAPAGGLTFAPGQYVSLPSALNSSNTIELFISFSPPGYSLNNSPVMGTNVSYSVGLNFVGAGYYGSTIGDSSQLQVWKDGSVNFPTMDSFYGTGSVSWTMGSPDVVYINGVALQDAESGSTSSGVQTAGNFQLGGSSISGGEWFTGTIYMARFLSTAVSASNIALDTTYMNQAMANRGVPVAMGSQATSNVAIITGDSISAQTHFSTALLPPPNWTIDNTGVPAFATSNIIHNGATLTDTSFHPYAANNIELIWLGANDCPFATPYTSYNNVANYARERRLYGWKVMVGTVLSHNSGCDAGRDVYNTLLRNGWSNFADELVDFAANPNIGADGAYSNSTYFADGIHPTLLANNTIIIPMYQNAVNRLVGNTATSGNPTVVNVGGGATPSLLSANQCYNGTGTGTNTLTCALSNVPVGSLIYVGADWGPSGTTISSVTDTGGDTCTAVSAASSGGNENWNQNFLCPNAVAETTDTVTITFSNSNATYMTMTVANFFGTATSSVVDAYSNWNTGTSASPTANGLTTTVAGDLVITSGSLASMAATKGLTPGGAFAGIYTSPATVQPIEYELAPLTGSVTSSFATSSSTSWALQSVAVKPGVIASPYQMLAQDVYLICNPSGGNITVNLPDAIGLTGQTVTIKNVQSSGSNTCTISAINSETIDGSSSSVALANSATAVYKSQLVSASAAGANWISVQSPVLAGNSAFTTSLASTTSTALATLGLALPALPISTTRRGHCALMWQQATGVSTVQFGINTNNAPTDLWVTASTLSPAASVTYTTITSAATTPVTASLTPSASATGYLTNLDFVMTTGSSNTVTLTIYGLTGNASDALNLEPGSSCGWEP